MDPKNLKNRSINKDRGSFLEKEFCTPPPRHQIIIIILFKSVQKTIDAVQKYTITLNVYSARELCKLKNYDIVIFIETIKW